MIEKPRIHPLQHYDLHLMQAEKDNLLGHHYTVANIAAQVADMTDTVVTETIIHAAADAGITDLYLMDKTFILEAIQEKMEREKPKLLTMDELKKMNGEPVWVAELNYWAVVEVLDRGKWAGVPFVNTRIDNVDIGWNAESRNLHCYRHKPKEDAK